MLKTIQEDVLKYVYHELQEEEKKELENKLFSNEVLESEFYDFVDLKQQLGKAELKPKRKTIENILNYSKSFDLEAII
jgi:hypothetical protein